jgi:hypothetical protein
MSLLLRRWLLILAVMCAGVPGAAAADPHIRTGLCVGVGFGIESVAWTDEYGDRHTEGSGSGNARIGYALKPDLVLGVEMWAWANEYEIGTHTLPVPVHVKIAATDLCATYFPGGGGFFLRLGAGFAYGEVRVEPPASVTEVAPSKNSETGFAVNFSPGYEFRVARHLALGAQGDVVYLGLGGPLEDVFGYGINAQFNWYW